ncbi:MAG: hypothetical protein ACXWEY_15775 [Bacteroidia bacterium]
MKFLFVFISTVLFFLTSCKKEDKNLTDAIITGEDVRTCMCCGGFMITFNGETKAYQNEYKLIDNANAAEFGISEKDSFPMFVKVNCEAKSKCGELEIIHIKRLEKK